MDGKQLRSLKPELELFLERFLPLFGRVENQAHANHFVQGLLLGGERRNTENVAEKIGGGVVRTLQKFISEYAWCDRAVLEELAQVLDEALGDEEAMIAIDETGFPKQGRKSAGVQRQYSGTLGRVENCQIGVFANYVSRHGHALLDRRLYLPQDWADDAERCREAGIPPGVIFRKKPQLGLEMLAEAVARGMRFRWVVADCVYGDSPTFVQGVRELGKWYVVDVSADSRVWLRKPTPLVLPKSKTGRPRTTPRFAEEPISVGELLSKLQAADWKRITIAEGSQGPRMYEYTEFEVWFSEEGLPTEQPERLIVRRSLGQSAELKCHRSNAPREVPLRRVAEAAGQRWTVETDFKSGKGECGLDEYETRSWRGWHHHTALSMLALLFLTLQKQRLGEKRAADDGSRSAGAAAALPRRAALGRARDSGLVRLAAGKKSSGQAMSRQAKTPRKSAAK